jgi:Fic-DOC domain mobile mystery protein B
MTSRMKYPEGATPLELEELDGLRFRHITTRAQLDHLEQVNVEAGLRWLARQRRRDVLTDHFAKGLHKRLFGDVWTWAGSFRTTEKNIGVEPLRISVELRMLMDDARYWVENRIFPPTEAAVRLHHRLVFIHPFPDGNGRHARIMADAMLTGVCGVEAIDWAGGHNLQKMNKRRAAYIAALKAADAGDIGPLLAFVGASR